MWQLPESELRILGDVAGKDVLELGCGAAQWSILLARAGRPPGRPRQLRAAARARPDCDGGGGRRVPARPRERRVRSASGRELRHRLCGPRRQPLRRPAPLGPGGRPPASARRHRSPSAASTPFEWIWLEPGDRHVGRPSSTGRTSTCTGWMTPDGLGRVRASVRRVDPALPPERARGRGASRGPAAWKERRRRTGREEENAWARRWPMEQIWKVRKA